MQNSEKLHLTPGEFYMHGPVHDAQQGYADYRSVLGSMNCEGGPVPQGRPAALVFGPLPQNYGISKPRYVVGTSNSSIHFHSVAIGAARRLSRRFLHMLQKKAWCFLSRFQTQRSVDADFQSFRSNVTSQPLSPLNRAADTFGFKLIAFWGIAIFVA